MYVHGATTIRHLFRVYALFSDPKTSDRVGFIKFAQLSGLFRNVLAYSNGTGYKRNLNYNILFSEYKNKTYEFSSRPSEYVAQLRQYS